MLHVAHVESNLKGGVQADLGLRTLIVGPNRSGKSSIVQAVELALTGAVGRVGKLPARLMALAKMGEPALDARAVLSDGSTVAYRVAGNTARASKPEWNHDGRAITAPPGAFLTEPVAAILRGDPAKTLRPALVKIACAAFDLDKMIVTFVPEAFAGEWRSRWGATAGDTDADRLAALAEALRDEARAAKKATAALSGPIVEAPDPAEIAALRAQLQAAMDAERAAANAASAHVSLVALEAGMIDLRKQLAPLGDIVSADLRSRAVDGAAAVVELMSQHAGEQLAPPCLVCRSAVPREQLPGLADQIEALRFAVRSAQAEQRRQVALRERLRAAEARAEALRIEAATPVQPAEPASAIEARLLVLLQQESAARDSANARAAMARAATAYDAAKALSAATDRMVAEALEGAVTGFEKRVNAGLARGKVAFQLFDAGKPVCRVTWAMDGASPVSLAALSGAEETDVVRALACAWANGVTEPARIVVVDEAMLDRESLGAVLAGFGHLDSVQSIVCCVPEVVPVEVPEGWTIIRLGDT